MSVYRIHVNWKDKELVVEAKSLDMTHPYFVSIKDIILPQKSSLIINPQDDDVRKLVGNANHIMIPFQKVALIEELSEEEHASASRVRSFKVEEGGAKDTPPGD
ncbi:DUF1820 family protein [Spirochaetia bacterium 38H-sp]|uniref:DUF1820 family protein n=1 Tax=Rarispira pelagica TaxID=3141764 RepID=A0ABU9UCL7_9SPIR